RFVPRRKLKRAAASRFAESHTQRFEHDARDVVLGLSLGEAERVDLHAVAHAPELRVLHAVALAAQTVPEPGEGPSLAHLFDEPNARIDEERNPSEYLVEVLLRYASLAHRVQDRDRGRERISDLLFGRRSRFLQVIATDVDRVP